MPSNVEIKARVADRAILEQKVRSLCGDATAVLVQEDTYFRPAHGRLKLRTFGDGRAELIRYERADQTGPRASDYEVAPVCDAARLRSVLVAALGSTGVIRKRRTLYLHDHTRIHLDEVEALGSFVELEVVLQPGQSRAEGERIARDLMEQLGIHPSDLLEGSYADLLTEVPSGSSDRM